MLTIYVSTTDIGETIRNLRIVRDNGISNVGTIVVRGMAYVRFFRIHFMLYCFKVYMYMFSFNISKDAHDFSVTGF